MIYNNHPKSLLNSEGINVYNLSPLEKDTL